MIPSTTPASPPLSSSSRTGSSLSSSCLGTRQCIWVLLTLAMTGTTINMVKSGARNLTTSETTGAYFIPLEEEIMDAPAIEITTMTTTKTSTTTTTRRLAVKEEDAEDLSSDNRPARDGSSSSSSRLSRTTSDLIHNNNSNNLRGDEITTTNHAAEVVSAKERIAAFRAKMLQNKKKNQQETHGDAAAKQENLSLVWHRSDTTKIQANMRPQQQPQQQPQRHSNEGMGLIATREIQQQIDHDYQTTRNVTTTTIRDWYMPLTTNNLWDDSKLLPDWLKSYFAWHQQQITTVTENNWASRRFLISVARKGNSSGGMTDRIRPIPALLRLAAQTKRLLLIHWEERPFSLEEFLVPPMGGMDWRVPSYMVGDVVTTQPQRNDWDDIVAGATRLDQTLITIKYQSWNYGELWYQEQTLQGESSVYDTFRDIWNVVFTPSPPVALRIQSNFEQMKLVPGEFATVHMRAFYDVNKPRTPEQIRKMARNAMNCVSNLRPGGPFFVASDNSLAIQTALAYGRSRGVTVVTANHGPQQQQPLHLDNSHHHRNKNGRSSRLLTPADFYDGFVDLYLMGETRCAAVGPGGFARWGHLLGYNNTCAIHHDGRKAKKCVWMDEKTAALLGRKEEVPGYPSPEKRIQVQREAALHHEIPKYHEPMLHH